MSNPKPNITIPVDLTNPGQFFACCGLLELADRIEPGATACFHEGVFSVRADVPNVLDCFFKCAVEVDTSVDDYSDAARNEPNEQNAIDRFRGRIYPMRLSAPFNLLLNWWNDPEAQSQKLKTWTAGQRVTDLLLGHHKKTKRKGHTLFVPIHSMREHFAKAVNLCPNDWLRSTMPIEAPMTFSYDSRVSRNNALDLGHTAPGIIAFSPAVDVLALIGMQRFRPRMVEPWTRNLYHTWEEELPVEIAPVAALGLIPSIIKESFEFPVKPRDAQGRFKLFGHAHPARRPNA
jgi:CRISPR-associated protein Csb3